jgi:CDP-diacylglycerol--glycerol-3-phosphate 3-phosphatidyltransferase/cardiolipin synthase
LTAPVNALKANLANTLTWIRIAAIPVVVWCFFSNLVFARPIAGIVFGLAAITDLLDGYVARRLGQTSKFGEFLDPVADKLMVAVVLVLLVQSDPRITVALTAAVIIGREITVSGLREWMAIIGERQSVAVSFGGKLKTMLQMFGIGFMVYQHQAFGMRTYDVGFVLLLVAAAMTLWSMFVYIRSAWPLMTSGH